MLYIIFSKSKRLKDIIKAFNINYTSAIIYSNCTRQDKI